MFNRWKQPLGATMVASILSTLLIGQPNFELPPTFTGVDSRLEVKSGRLVKLSPNFAATLSSGGQEVTLPAMMSLRRSDLPVASLPTGPQLITTAGDRILGKLQGGDSQSLRFLPKFLGDGTKAIAAEAWKVPLSSASVLWLTNIPADLPIDPARYEWLAANRNRDLIRLRNGDLDHGNLVGFDNDPAGIQVTFRSQGGETRTIPTQDLALVAFNPSLSRTRKPKEPYARIVLADSSRLLVTNVSIADGRLKGDSLFGVKVTVPVSQLMSLEVQQGNATDLADLKPRMIEQTGYLSMSWPWSANRNVHGAELRVASPIGDTIFDRGIGTHPRTVLTYDLSAQYHWFDALVGLDPTTRLKGQVSVRILVDGKEQDLPTLAQLKAGLAIPVRVNLQGARQLVLVTDYGNGGGVGADVNWCDAKLVK